MQPLDLATFLEALSTTDGQDVADQVAALRAAGAVKVYSEKSLARVRCTMTTTSL